MAKNGLISCPSPYAMESSEDCLFLNVYTKNVRSRFPVPVIAYIHPGGFYVGSGDYDHHGPEYLLEQDVILVTFNYRLSFFGFLSLEDDSRVTANAGLKDQVLALQWIKTNIHKFGGNSSSISLMGSSAGAFSVQLHLVSPMSLGLFHKAIIMSGGIPPQLRFPRHQTELAKRQAKLFNCSSNDLYECFKNIDTFTLEQSVYENFLFGRDNPIFLWLPIVESVNSQEEYFIADENPLGLIKEGNFQKVPILLGLTQHEIATSAADVLTSKTLLHSWLNDFNNVGPMCLLYNKSNEISKHLFNHYFPTGSANFTQLNEV